MSFCKTLAEDVLKDVYEQLKKLEPKPELCTHIHLCDSCPATRRWATNCLSYTRVFYCLVIVEAVNNREESSIQNMHSVGNGDVNARAGILEPCRARCIHMGRAPQQNVPCKRDSLTKHIQNLSYVLSSQSTFKFPVNFCLQTDIQIISSFIFSNDFSVFVSRNASANPVLLIAKVSELRTLFTYFATKDNTVSAADLDHVQ